MKLQSILTELDYLSETEWALWHRNRVYTIGDVRKLIIDIFEHKDDKDVKKRRREAKEKGLNR